MPGVLIVRIDGQLYYANALTVKDQVKAMMAQIEPPPRAVLIDAASQDQLDLTSADMLKGLVKELQGKGIQVCMAEVHAPVLAQARTSGLLDLIGEDHVYPTVEAAVNSIGGI